MQIYRFLADNGKIISKNRVLDNFFIAEHMGFHVFRVVCVLLECRIPRILFQVLIRLPGILRDGKQVSVIFTFRIRF